MDTLFEQICGQITRPVFFVTPDINWALGLEEHLDNYHIVCLEDHLVLDLLSDKVKVFCLKKEMSKSLAFRGKLSFKNTGAMLSLPEVQDYIEKNSGGDRPAVMYFKPSGMIDKVCKEKGYLQIGNSAELNKKWEDKLKILRLGEKYPELQVVPGKIMRLGEVKRDSSPYEGEASRGSEIVIQLSRGWAGKFTFLIKTREELEKLKKKFGNIEVKVSHYIEGRTYLNNACVVRGKVLQSPPALQINCPGKDFSSLPLATCGRQFGNLDLSEEQIIQIRKVTEKVGSLMAEEGYKGYFGLDFIVEESSGKVFLQEINPRLTASASFYTKLEIEAGKVPLMFYHVVEFLEPSVDRGTISPLSKGGLGGVKGTQLILRNTTSKSIKIKSDFKPGFYKLYSESLDFARESYQVTDVKSYPTSLYPSRRASEDAVKLPKTGDEFLLIAPGKGTEISPESELLRCESKFAVLDNGVVPESLKNGLLKMKRSLLE